MKNNIAKRTLFFLIAFLALGAIFGGVVLILSPSGKASGMPVSMLDHSPFHNFLIPGIVLFSLLGILPAITAWALLKRPACKIACLLNCYTDMYWGWTFCIYIAFALIAWIQIEILLLRAVHWLHTLYMFWAVAIIFFALLPGIRNVYRQPLKKMTIKNLISTDCL